MGRLLLLVVMFNLQCSIFNLVHAQTVGEAFYIYRNDGDFNAFFRDEVISIDFSREDAEGNTYDEIVTQRVVTADSVYMIPLAAIDSVGFVQPKTIYKEDAMTLDGALLDYLVSTDGMKLTFAPSLPTVLTPKEGDKIVSMELSDKLPYGFSGIARQITNSSSGIEVLCDSIDVTEVVEQFYGIAVLGDDTQDNISNRIPWRAPQYFIRDYNLPNTPINIPIDISGYITKKSIFDVNGKAEINVNIVPRTAVRITLVVDGARSHTKAHLVSRLLTKTRIDICGEASKDLKLNLLPNDGNYKGPWGIPLYLAIGPKLELSGEVLAELTVNATVDVVSDITYYPQTLLPIVSTLSPVLNRVDGTVKVSGFGVDIDRIGARGSLRAGAFFRGGVSPGDHKTAWVGIEADGGGKCDVDLLFDIERLREADRSTALYDELKSLCDLEVKPFFGVHFMASRNDDNYTFKVGPEFDDFGPVWFKGGLVPTFSDTRLTRSAQGALSADATTNITGACPIPYTVGFSLFDSQRNRVQNPLYFGEKYSVFNSFSSYSGTFDNLKADEKYTVYPTISLFGYPMLASPSAELNMDCPVKLSDFKVTKSQYQKGAFSNDGKQYDYRFDVTVTATLDDDAENISEWGYVYLDPDGKEAFIPLTQFGRSKTDDRWAYFRNGTPPFTCTLYGYVKYVGSDEAVRGEPHDYPLEYGETTCPDANHPHMIDLGLPSGTKWACCNVGASSPEGYGGYYAWGETNEKDHYAMNNYSYYINDAGTISINTDISGTEYDAATVNWGEEWRMPSEKQYRELENNTTKVWTTKNGVNGWELTGPSGNSVFFPAADHKSDNHNQSFIGHFGYYWSSTIEKADNSMYTEMVFPDVVVSASFDYQHWHISIGGSLYGGLSVRPVAIERKEYPVKIADFHQTSTNYQLNGLFWSSTLYESSPNDAYDLYSYHGNAGWHPYSRPNDQSVHPVR